MSHIASPVKSINTLTVYRLPAGRPLAVTRAIKVDGMTFFMGLDGKVYCDAIRDRSFYPLTRWRWASPLVNALARLGAITASDAKCHLDACDRADAIRARQERANQVKQAALKIGLKLTRRQNLILSKAIRGR